jgi:monothiol glutaredoxin
VTINERIEQQLNEFPVLLYMKGTPDFPQCGFSSQVVGALKQCQQRFAFVNILEDADLRQGLKEYSEWPTFPQLYVKGELIGGSDIVVQMYESGDLKKALDEVD